MKKTPWKKIALCFVAVFMSLSLACGCFFLLYEIPNTPQQEQPVEDQNKKSWDDFSTTKLNGSGTESNPWKISSADDLAFLSSSLGKLKEENVTSRASIVSAMSGQDLDSVVAEAKEVQASMIADAEISGREYDPNEYIGAQNYFELSDDIDLSKYNWDPIPNLNGSFDGNGHTIDIGKRTFSTKDLLANPSAYLLEDGGIGIAPFLGENTSSQNMTIQGEIILGDLDPSQILPEQSPDEVKGEYYDFGEHKKEYDSTNAGGYCVGGIRSILRGGGTLSQTNVNVQITNNNQNISAGTWIIGGVVGMCANGFTLSDCNSYGKINLNNEVDTSTYGKKDLWIGGIAGWVVDDDTTTLGSKFKNCVNFAEISIHGLRVFNTDVNAGGIIGQILTNEHSDINISNCVNFGNINADIDNIHFIGGVVGICQDDSDNSDISGLINYGYINSNSPDYFVFNRERTPIAGGIFGSLNTADSAKYFKGLYNYAPIRQICSGGLIGMLSSRSLKIDGKDFMGISPSVFYNGYVNNPANIDTSRNLRYILEEMTSMGSDLIQNFLSFDTSGYGTLYAPSNAFSFINIIIKYRNSNGIESTYRNGAEIFKNQEMQNIIYHSGAKQLITFKCIDGKVSCPPDIKFLFGVSKEEYQVSVNINNFEPSDVARVEYNSDGYIFESSTQNVSIYINCNDQNAWLQKSGTMERIKQYIVSSEDSEFKRYSDGTAAGTSIVINNNNYDNELPIEIKDKERVSFTITPNVGYAVAAVRMSSKDINFMNMNGTIFTDDRYTYNLITNANERSQKGYGVEVDPSQKNVPSNNLNSNVYLGELKFNVTISSGGDISANIADLSYIYVFYIKLNYYVTFSGDVRDNIQPVSFGERGEQGKGIALWDYLNDTHIDDAIVTATIESQEIKKFTDLTQKSRQSLFNSGSGNYSIVTYDDLIGKYIEDINTDKFTINLSRSPRAKWTFNLSLEDRCNTWDDLTIQRGEWGGSTTPNSGSYDESTTLNFKPSANGGYSAKGITYKYFWSDSELTLGGTQADGSALTQTIWDHYIAMDNTKQTLQQAACEGNALYENFVSKTIYFYSTFELQQYDLTAERSGSGYLTLKIFEQNSMLATNVLTSESKKVYYNTPVILTATPMQNAAFVGYFLLDNGSEKLLSTQGEYHFVLSGVDDNVKQVRIVARFALKNTIVGGNPLTLKNGIYEVTSADDLVWLANQVNLGNLDDEKVVVKLKDDIDMSECTTFVPIGTQEHPFKGVFDGNFKQIYNLALSNSANVSGDLLSCRGLFGYTDDATIKNVTFVDGSVAGYLDVGIAVGHAKDTTFNRVENYSTNLNATALQYYDVNGKTRTATFDRLKLERQDNVEVNDHVAQFETPESFVARENFGGLVGYAENCTFVGCSNRASVTGIDYVGGIAGMSCGTTIDQCYNVGALSSTRTSGQIVCNPSDNETTIKDCFYGAISINYDDSLLGTSGVINSTETTLLTDSKIWTIVNGNLALRIFYW